MALEDGHGEDDSALGDPSFGLDGQGEPVWRHPSELGAMLAAANGIAPPPPRPTRRRLRLATVGVTLGLIGVTIISLSQPGPNTGFTQSASVAQRAGVLAPADDVPQSSTTIVPIQRGEVRIERWTNDDFAAGAGVLIFDDGYIATSRDLIAGATELSIVTSSGERYDGQIIGADYIIDIAVLKIDAALPAAKVADSVPGRNDSILVADPWSNEPKKNKLRGVDMVLADRYGIHRQELLEFDNAAGSASEGAPVLNTNREVVGLIVPVDNESAFNYAIDIRAVRTAAYQIIETGFVNHVAWLGIKGVDRTANDGGGVEVRDVATGSPAHQIGLKYGDVISSVARRKVVTMDDLHRALRSVEPGDEAEIVFERNSKMFDEVAELGIRANVTNRN